jgi:hypothetical protein
VRLAQLGQGAEQVASGVGLVGVTNELGVQLLVTGEVDATSLLVSVLQHNKQHQY